MSVEQVRRLLPAPDAGISETKCTATQPNESPLQSIWQLARAVRAELSDPRTSVMALGSAASAILGSPVDAVLVGTVLTGNAILAAAQRLRAEQPVDPSCWLSRLRRPARSATGPDGPAGVHAGRRRATATG